MNASRKLIMTAAAGAVAAVLMAAPSSAHECFNASRAARADAVIARHSHGWFTQHTSWLLAIFVLECAQNPSGACPPPPPLSAADLAALHSGNFEALVGEILGFAPREDAVVHLLAFTDRVEAEAACLGVPRTFLTLAHATAAGGAEDKGGASLADGKGIDHFPEVYGDQIFAAYGTVFSGGPSACH